MQLNRNNIVVCVRFCLQGHFALSLATDSNIKHFQIEHTDQGRYRVGGHDFKGLDRVVSHYRRASVYSVDDVGHSLCEPFVKLQ